MKNMKILITGANGMLATNIIEVLLEKGYYVRGLLRHKESYKGIKNSNLELIEGNFTDIKSASAALEGCDAIIHSAAIISQNLLHYTDYVSVNVEATIQLIKLAQVYNIEKFIYVSSANTIGCGSETTPCTPPLSQSLYGKSKAAGELFVIEAGGIVVNPTFMIGRYGSPSGSNRIFRMARRITLCPPGGKNFIDVEDAALGVVAAMEHGRSGEKYIIGDKNMSFQDFFRLFPQVRYIVVIPRWIILTAGCFGSIIRALGIRTDLSLNNAKILCLSCFYDNSKARRELNFNPKIFISG